MNLKPLAAVLMLLCCVAPANAQAVKVRFHDGLVSLSAQNAPLRTILAEWAKLGGATVTNAERIPATPLTLELNDIPERQAIDILLRNVSGYLAAPRPAAKPGVAVYDRILILATSTAPRSAPPPAAAQGRQAPPQPQQPQIVPLPADPDDPADEDVPPQIAPFPRPGGPGRPGPYGVPQPPEPDDDQPEPTSPPAAGNPFGVPTGATSRPGVITPVPQVRPQPGTRPRPSPSR